MSLFPSHVSQYTDEIHTIRPCNAQQVGDRLLYLHSSLLRNVAWNWFLQNSRKWLKKIETLSQSPQTLHR